MGGCKAAKLYKKQNSVNRGEKYKHNTQRNYIRRGERNIVQELPVVFVIFLDISNAKCVNEKSAYRRNFMNLSKAENGANESLKIRAVSINEKLTKITIDSASDVI